MLAGAAAGVLESVASLKHVRDAATPVQEVDGLGIGRVAARLPTARQIRGSCASAQLVAIEMANCSSMSHGDCKRRINFLFKIIFNFY